MSNGNGKSVVPLLMLTLMVQERYEEALNGSNFRDGARWIYYKGVRDGVHAVARVLSGETPFDSFEGIQEFDTFIKEELGEQV